MRGCWLGLSSKHTRTDLLHAVLLGRLRARQALDALVAIQPAAGGSPARRWRHGICTLAPVGGRAGRHHDSVVRHDAPARPYVRWFSGRALTNAINGAIAVLDRLADR
jgi:hypothetical protein